MAEWFGWSKRLVENLERELAGVGGVQVHDYDKLPAKILALPSVLLFWAGGNVLISAGGPNILHQVVRGSVFLGRTVTPEAVRLSVEVAEGVVRAVAGDITLGGEVVHCEPPTPPEPFFSGIGTMEWSGEEYVGFTFELDVKKFLNGLVVA